jgi:hypothetical protein
MSNDRIDWNISYLDQEYAMSVGDPIIGIINACSKQEAETIANRLNFGGVYGVWAWKAQNVAEKISNLKTC